MDLANSICAAARCRSLHLPSKNDHHLILYLFVFLYFIATDITRLNGKIKKRKKNVGRRWVTTAVATADLLHAVSALESSANPLVDCRLVASTL